VERQHGLDHRQLVWRERQVAATTFPSPDAAWLVHTARRDRALDSLLVDGLVKQTAEGRFALCREAASPSNPGK